MLSTGGHVKSRTTKVVLFFPLKLTTDSFTRNMCYNLCMLVSQDIFKEIYKLETKELCMNCMSIRIVERELF